MKEEPAPAPSEWQLAHAVLARHRRRLLRRVGVIGVDLGIKRRAGALLPGPAIRVHVARKIDVAGLHPRGRLPDSIEGVPVDVVESTFRVRAACPNATAAHRLQVDPLVAGCSIGRFGETEFGTLGPIAVAADGKRGALTCAHVCATGDVLRQPHRLGRSVGSVLRDQLTQDVDAAFLAFDPAIASQAAAMELGPVSRTPVVPGNGDLPFAVELVGACSGRTRGFVVSLNFQGTVHYPDGSHFVVDQACIEADDGSVFARSGDSGGIVVSGNRPVAMLIAADDSGTGLATPIGRVMSAMGVTLA